MGRGALLLLGRRKKRWMRGSSGLKEGLALRVDDLGAWRNARRQAAALSARQTFCRPRLTCQKWVLPRASAFWRCFYWKAGCFWRASC
jgi:hypothetical protein